MHKQIFACFTLSPSLSVSWVFVLCFLCVPARVVTSTNQMRRRVNCDWPSEEEERKKDEQERKKEKRSSKKLRQLLSFYFVLCLYSVQFACLFSSCLNCDWLAAQLLRYSLSSKCSLHKERQRESNFWWPQWNIKLAPLGHCLWWLFVSVLCSRASRHWHTNEEEKRREKTSSWPLPVSFLPETVCFDGTLHCKPV